MKSNMKPFDPFDIDKAIAGEPVFTRSGKDATYVGKIKDYVGHPYVFFVDGALLYYGEDGTTAVRSIGYDLFMKVEQTYNVGDILFVSRKDIGQNVMICQVGPRVIQLISTTGNRFSDKTAEYNWEKGITDSVIEKLFDDGDKYEYKLVERKGTLQYES